MYLALSTLGIAAVALLVSFLYDSHVKPFLIRHRGQATKLAVLFAVATITLLVGGCAAPTWLTDASSIIGLVSTSIAAIGAFVAGLTGNAALAAGLAVIAEWSTKLETALADIEQLISQYDAAPDATLLANIEATLLDAETNIKQDFGNLGLPASILSVVAGIAALALSQLEAWGSLIPALKAKAMVTLTIKTPYTKEEYKSLVNGILTTPTGDPEIDAALAKVARV